MADTSVVFDKLNGFETDDDLADFFRGYGIKAQPSNARSCAISQFVRMETGLPVSTSVSSVTVWTDLDESDLAYYGQLTSAMESFIKKYDQGAYPDLVEEGYEVTPCYRECCS